MGDAQRILKEYYTYGDYKSWDDDLRWELIDGEAFCMSPAPGTAHQSLVVKLIAKLEDFFEGRECKVFVAPLDVTLPRGGESEDEIDTVVQPDIMILCDKSKLHDNGIKGAPDVIFEILSPSTARRDLDDKLRQYERAGVKEYLIADPRNRFVIAHRRDEEGRYSWKKIYEAGGILEFGLFPELTIPLSSVWGDTP